MVTDAMKTDSQRLGNGKKTFNIKQIVKKLLGIEERIDNIEDGQFTTDIDIKNTAHDKCINFYHGDTKLSRIGGNAEGMLYLEPGMTEDGIKAAKIINQRAYNPNVDIADIATVGTLDGYTPMIRTTGNQTKAGQLTLQGTSNEQRLSIKSTNIDVNEPGTGTRNGALMSFTDMNNSWLGYLYISQKSDGSTQLICWVRNSDGTNKTIILAQGDA